MGVSRLIHRASLAIARAALISTGCTVGPEFVRPDEPKVSRYTHAEEADASASQTTAVTE